MPKTATTVGFALLWSVGERVPIGVSADLALALEAADWTPRGSGCATTSRQRGPPELAGYAAVVGRVELRAMHDPGLALATRAGVTAPDIGTLKWRPTSTAAVETGVAVGLRGARLALAALVYKDFSPCVAGCGSTGTGLELALRATVSSLHDPPPLSIAFGPVGALTDLGCIDVPPTADTMSGVSVRSEEGR